MSNYTNRDQQKIISANDNKRIISSKSEGDLKTSNGNNNQFLLNESPPPPPASLLTSSNRVTAQDHSYDQHHYHHYMNSSRSSYSFPGDSLSVHQSGIGVSPSPSITNLSDSFASLYLPQFAHQISNTIMSGLNWINQINAATLFQNFWSNGFLRRRFSSSRETNNSIDPHHPHPIPIAESPSSSSLTYSQYKFARILNGTIRLQTLKPSELIELSSFGLVELDQDVEPGIGHEFQRYENEKPTWCDSCGEFLFPSVMNDKMDHVNDHQRTNNSNIKSLPLDTPEKGLANTSTEAATTSINTATITRNASVQADHLLRTYFQCTKCKYVCHWKCLNLIRIDCQPSEQQKQLPSSNTISTMTATKTFQNSNDNSSSSPSISDNIQKDLLLDASGLDDNNNHNGKQEPSLLVVDMVDSTVTPAIDTSFDDPFSNNTLDHHHHHRNITSTTSICSTISNQNTLSQASSLDEDTMTNNTNDDSEDSPNISISKDNSNSVPSAADASQVNNKASNQIESSSSSYLITPRVILDLRAKILKYNERVRSKGSGLGITLIDEEKGLFRGFLRVHMNLTRPINVVAGKRPPSIYDIINEQEENNQNNQRRTLTSFYMPRDTVKNIHITSDSTSLQVIKAMLKKFKVVDNPQKFALYLRRRFPEEELVKLTGDGGEVIIDNNNLSTRISDDNQNEMTISKFLKTAGHEHSLKRLHDHERPLILQLEFDSFAYGSVDIVLQENDNADIAWEAFEIPELKNFLKILEREEGEHMAHVIAHYKEMRRILQALIDYEESKSINKKHTGAGPILSVTS